MKIKQIYHIGLPCNDLERAMKFYTDVLGMKCTKVGFDTDSGGPYKKVYGSFPAISRLFMEDGMCLVLFQRPKPIERGDFDDGTSHIALEVSAEDFDKDLRGTEKSRNQGADRRAGFASDRKGNLFLRSRNELYIQLWSPPDKKAEKTPSISTAESWV